MPTSFSMSNELICFFNQYAGKNITYPVSTYLASEFIKQYWHKLASHVRIGDIIESAVSFGILRQVDGGYVIEKKQVEEQEEKWYGPGPDPDSNCCDFCREHGPCSVNQEEEALKEKVQDLQAACSAKDTVLAAVGVFLDSLMFRPYDESAREKLFWRVREAEDLGDDYCYAKALLKAEGQRSGAILALKEIRGGACGPISDIVKEHIDEVLEEICPSK